MLFAPAEVAQLTTLTDHAAVAVEPARDQEEKRWSDLLDDRDRIAQDLCPLVFRRLVSAG